MKRLLALVLLAALTLTMIPFTASAAEGNKLIALTFDDGPDYYDTPKLLDGLKERGVKVTFFLQGERAEWYPKIARRAYEEGHEIGCHSWDHPNLVELSDSQLKSQFDRSYAVLDEICGQDVTYLVRPPYGNTNDRVREIIARPLIQWSVDTMDWDLLNTYKVRDAILRDAYDGAIVLLHDIHSTSVSGALLAIDILLEEGYEFVTVSELYRRRGVALENGQRYYHCKPTGTDLGPIPTPEIIGIATENGIQITMNVQSDAPIYYTTDGTVPDGNSSHYEGSFTISQPCTIRAIASYDRNGSRSEQAILEPGDYLCDAPSITVTDGMLTLSHDRGDVPIRYTLDGTAASLNSTVYQAPVALSGGVWIRAVAGGGAYRISGETVRYYSNRGILSADLNPGEWYFDAMDELAARGLMMGVGNDRFAPEETLTRGMLVALLYRCSGDGLNVWEQTSAFTDVPRSMYYAEAVEWAWRNDIVKGYSDTEFRPEGLITREELCTVIFRYLENRGTPLAPGASCEELYDDYAQIQPWAVESVEAMTAAGLIRGNGHGMEPAGNATRAQVAAILIRMLEYVERQSGD